MNLLRSSAVFAFVVGLGCTQVDVIESPVEPPIPPSMICDGPRIRPFSSFAMFVGDTVRVSVQPLAGCDAGVTFHWRAGDPKIAQVDSLTGLIRGMSIGRVAVVAIAMPSKEAIGAAVVDVVARP